jgi:hypothetical protein
MKQDRAQSKLIQALGIVQDPHTQRWLAVGHVDGIGCHG